MKAAEPKPLNKLEVWVADHAVPIFMVTAVLILLGAGAVILTYERTGDAEHNIDILRPKVAHIIKCNQRSLVDQKRAEECAARIRVGLINCRRVRSCRAAYLALATFPEQAASPTSSSPSSTTATTAAPASGSQPKGGAIQTPSTNGHQPGSPGSPGHQEGGETTESPQSSSPVAEAPQAESPASTPEAPSAPAPAPPVTAKPSAPGVEVCVLEHTCLGLELGLGGLLPKGTQ